MLTMQLVYSETLEGGSTRYTKNSDAFIAAVYVRCIAIVYHLCLIRVDAI